MQTYKFYATANVEVYTEVNANSEEEALKEAIWREVSLHKDQSKNWIIDDATGIVTDIYNGDNPSVFPRNFKDIIDG
jgi:ribosomal silencing factor RsfS